MTRRKVVFGIYNADGSFFGELRYSFSKVIGKGSCSLCDLTHGWNPFGKRQWITECKFSELDIQLIHYTHLVQHIPKRIYLSVQLVQ